MQYPTACLLLLTALAAAASDEASRVPAAPELPPVRVQLASLGAPARVKVRAEGLRIRAGERELAPEEGVAVLTAAGGQVRLGDLKAASLRVEGGLLTLEAGGVTRDYPGALVVGADGGTLTLANECSFERYLEGVLAGECPASFHPEALRAMAIAARSYSFRKAYLAGAPLCDLVHCQVYRGATGIRAPIRAAVESTAGLVATYGAEVIEAVYCADCGGHTEANEAVWNGRPIPYLRAVPDAPEGGAPYCAGNRGHRWSLPLSAARLASLLGKKVGRPALEVLDTTPGGRVAKLRLAPAPAAACPAGDEKKPERVFSGEEWRRLLGLTTVKSLRFEIRDTDRGVELQGRGFGHGVGLCQHGSNGQAKSGRAAEEILRHYYTGIEIGPLPPLREARARFQRAYPSTLASRKGKPKRR